MTADGTTIVNRLMPLAEKPPSVTTPGAGTRYSWRLDIPARSRAVPVTQNIPSNLHVIGDRADGTIRPPLLDPTETPRDISSVADIEREVWGILVGVGGVDEITIAESTGGWARPHVEIEGDVNQYIEAAEQLRDEYVGVFEPDG